MVTEVDELERLFRRLAEEKESGETPKLLEQSINALGRLSGIKVPGSVPASLVNDVHREDLEENVLKTLYELSLKKQEREQKNKAIANLFC